MLDNDNTNKTNNTDKGYSITSHGEHEAGKLKDQAQGIINTQEKIDASNATAETKATASTLNAADAGIQAVGTLMSATTRISESVMMPVLQKMGALKASVVLPTAKLMDPVFGIDLHMVTIPPSPAPVPMPHPYGGMMFRLKDFASCEMLEMIPVPPETPDMGDDEASMEAYNDAKKAELKNTALTMAVGMLGASVKVGRFPRATAGTPSKMIPHIPMGAGFHPVYSRMVKKNHGHSLLGSLFVVADGEPLSATPPHMHNNCWDVGVFSMHNVRPNRNADKKPKFPAHLYVPSGAIIPIPQGKPVLTNLTPAPINPLTVGARLFRAGLGKLRRKNEKMLRKLSDKAKANGKNTKMKCKFFTAASKLLGTGTSHPADVASGHFYTDNVDFSLTGIIPLEWERTYYSHSEYEGPLGIGWHHEYDMALDLSGEDDMVTLRMNDGRLTGFDLIEKGETTFNRKEKLWLHRDTDDSYTISDQGGLVFRFTKKCTTIRTIRPKPIYCKVLAIAMVILFVLHTPMKDY